MFLASYDAKLSHLLQYLTISQMTNLDFGSHSGFSLPTHLSHGGFVDYNSGKVHGHLQNNSAFSVFLC